MSRQLSNSDWKQSLAPAQALEHALLKRRRRQTHREKIDRVINPRRLDDSPANGLVFVIPDNRPGNQSLLLSIGLLFRLALDHQVDQMAGQAGGTIADNRRANQLIDQQHALNEPTFDRRITRFCFHDALDDTFHTDCAEIIAAVANACKLAPLPRFD